MHRDEEARHNKANLESAKALQDGESGPAPSGTSQTADKGVKDPDDHEKSGDL